MSREFNDKTPMPFGKHKGLPLEEVPASYLFWLEYTLHFAITHPELAKYIESNRSVLEYELEST